ncbi:hypothetical protein [Anaeromyxobacter diazotrophicus]|uniref:Uncharacterized protein n=1 Tax=Anaeromyxobacter diazotrophicus TaxID=2590199 RepID=A0A7I9VKM1_9BACT|nr:hypothetical protein [Anaeromyxobacter diazotrophicus]GEJ56941.1 hypothetical protein AMYX_16820 [Anaeromyxobacter diazotrophicus]
MDLVPQEPGQQKEPATQVKKRGRVLRSPENLRQLVASQIRAVERSELSVEKKARLLTPLAKELREAIMLVDRIDQIEAKLRLLQQQRASGR